MARISLNDASEYDHGVHVGVFREKLGPQRQFERPRNILDLDVVFGASGAAQRMHGAAEQSFGHFGIPLGHDDTEFHLFGRR